MTNNELQGRIGPHVYNKVVFRVRYPAGNNVAEQAKGGVYYHAQTLVYAPVHQAGARLQAGTFTGLNK